MEPETSVTFFSTLSTTSMICLFAFLAFYVMRVLRKHEERTDDRLFELRNTFKEQRDERDERPPVTRLQACAYCDRILMRHWGRVCRNCGAPNPTYEANEGLRLWVANRYPPPPAKTGKLRASFHLDYAGTLEEAAAGRVHIES